MPGKIKVKILAGRNLPVMDRSGDTTDAYVEIKFSNTTYKTDVCRKTLNPQWNSEWYRFEVDDAELQDEPLQLRLMDHDTYSANDAIGKVYLNLNPLLLPGLPLPVKNIWTLEATINSSSGSQGGSVMTGWIPVYDTMHGIRGEVNIIVKVELFSDFNKFRQSSCGVQFYYSPNVPHGYHAQVIHGFVEELIVSDDPEYKWIDKIRTPRASNEARQTQFFKLSGEVQRKIGLKALDLGGNAVIGYVQNFDLEGESGIVARGIGTAVTLIKLQDIINPLTESATTDDSFHCSQSKIHPECSESDDSLPLISRSPSRSPVPRSPINIHTTRVGNQFPKYERLKKQHRPAFRIAEYEASSMKRQMSLQHSPRTNMRKGGAMSTQSLAEDLIGESPLKAMLALEDMRGERTSAFSRGLKNLRYLPKRMIQMKSKISDSFDDESDQDSIYSSTWSMAGSDSARSSILDLRQSIRRKKFSHKKNESGIAALLIRSVHAGFPLDSVLEDRETPTPSPVNFMKDIEDSTDHQLRTAGITDDEHSKKEPIEKILEMKAISSRNIFEPTLSYEFSEKDIPMNSSSETDTSTSEDDEPSESSTNYNILDDSFSAVEQSSLSSDKSITKPPDFIGENETSLRNILQKNDSATSEEFVHTSSNSDEPNSRLLEEMIEISRDDSIPEGIILDYDSTADEDYTPLIPSAHFVLEDEKEKENKMINLQPETVFFPRTPSLKLKLLTKQRSFDIDEGFGITATSTPKEELDGIVFPVKNNESIKKSTTLLTSDLIEPLTERPHTPLIDLESEVELMISTSIPKVEEKKLEIVPVVHNENIILPKEIPNSENTKNSIIKIQTQENHLKTQVQSPKIMPTLEPSPVTPAPYERYLFHTGSVEEKSSPMKKEKVTKKVARTETVIYKGPPKEKEKPPPIETPENHKVVNEKIVKPVDPPTNLLPPSPTIMIAPSDLKLVTADCHLRVPTGESKEVNIHSPYPLEDKETPQFPVPQAYSMEAQIMSERFRRKYRQHCMLDLIKTIDVKMMVHHSDRRDSKKKRKDKNHGNPTPSPDSIHRMRHRRNSRSKSPEKHHHSHHSHSHHSHQISPLANRSLAHSANPLNPSHPSPTLKKDIMSCYASTETLNLSRNNTALCLNEPPQSIMSEKLISNQDLESSEEPSKAHEIAATELAISSLNELSKIEIGDMPMDVLKKSNISTMLGTLSPENLESSTFESHSESSFGELQVELSVTKTTNISNMIDETCVPCPPVIPRQQEEPPASPVHPPVFAGSVGSKTCHSPANKNSAVPLHRRSSDSDLSITPKGNSLAGSDKSMGGHLRPSTAIVRTMNQDALEMLEYPFLTMQQYPPGFVMSIGGLVSARSVKLIERISNLEEPEGRDAWWKEIRMEVRSHARALGCNVVLGYKEEISICDDVCVLNASGTAAVINLLNTSQDQDILLNRSQQTTVTCSLETEKDKNLQKNKESTNKNEKIEDPPVTHLSVSAKIKRISESNDHEIPYIPFQNACNLCHLPYSETSVPFRVDVSKCAICRRAKVPDVLFTTIELPENIPMTGRGVFLQATVCKSKRDLRGELNAKEISDCLPFLEYELHSLLLNKLKVKGMNAIFGLKVQVSVGERLVIGMAVGTAVFLTALPTPSIPKIASGNAWHNEEQLADIQRSLIETVKKNREFYRLIPVTDNENGRTGTSDTDESDDDLPDLDLSLGTKDACVLEVDDVEDMDRINLLIDETPPEDFHVVNTQTIPGLEDLEIVRNLQMFTQVSRAKIPTGQFASMPSKYFARMLQTIFFKLRRMVPCALCDMQFKIALPEQDEIQLSVVGMALGLGEPTRMNKHKKKVVNNSVSKDQLKKMDDNDLIFSLDEDQAENINSSEANNQSQISIQNISPITNYTHKSRSRSPFKTKQQVQHRQHKHVPLKERYGVDITPLSYLPGGKIERYLGNLNVFFIRESTSIRENGGLSGFTHSFLMEVLAIVRAHITALGGNAMVAFFMTQCILLHSPHKNQGQCLINVGGDVVSVSYFGDERHNQNF